MKPANKNAINAAMVLLASTSYAPALVTLNSANSFVVSTTSDPGSLTVTGDLSVLNTLDLGTSAGSSTLPAFMIQWIGSTKTTSLDNTDPSSQFQWRDNLTGGPAARVKMRLDANNSLSLLDSTGSSPNIVLNGSTGGISAISLSVSGSGVITSANLSGSIQQLPVLELNGMISSIQWSGGMQLGPYTTSTPTSLASGVGARAESQANLAVGWGVRAIGIRSVAFGHNSQAHGYESISTGRETRAYGNLNFVGGWASQTYNYNSIAYGHYCMANSLQDGDGYSGDAYAIAMGCYSGATNTYTIALGHSAQATAPHATAVGLGAIASAPASVSIGRSLVSNTPYEMTTGCYANVSTLTNNWNESDALFRLGNGTADNQLSDAITTRKNGQTTLTNKAWKQNPAVVPSPGNSNAEALVVEGNTRLRGKVVIEQVQGDIAMGPYQ